MAGFEVITEVPAGTTSTKDMRVDGFSRSLTDILYTEWNKERLPGRVFDGVGRSIQIQFDLQPSALVHDEIMIGVVPLKIREDGVTYTGYNSETLKGTDRKSTR